MKTPPRKKLLTVIVNTALLTGLCSMAPQTFAATWNLSNSPLGFGNKTPANILLLVDDSGSMDWEIMSSDLLNDGLLAGNSGTSARNNLDATVGNCRTYAYGVDTQSASIGGCGLALDTEWRFRNSNYNRLYFDPNSEYPPWSGFNADGVTAFGDMSFTAALANPWTGWRASQNGNEVINLATYHSGGLSYYTWADGNSDGYFDNGEQSTPNLLVNASATVKQKFANWFTYYRSRHLVAKAAFGRVIAGLNGHRVALATLHNNGSVNTPLALIDSTPTGEINRKTLLSRLYQIIPNNGTPLQTTLKQAGKYLSGDGSNTLFPNNTAAPLSVAQGGECQRNYTLLMTDGFYNGTYNDNSPNIGNADADSTTSPWDGGRYADSADKTLGDIAMYYYENDMFPSVANLLVPVTEDPATHQHMVTYTVAFGVFGNLKGMPEDYDSHPSWGAWPGWPAGTSADNFNDSQRIDDLRHAAYNGRGKFIAASSATDLIAGVKDLTDDLTDQSISASSVTFNASSLRTNSTLYQATYNSLDWSGDLNFTRVTTAGVIVKPPIENASTVLTATAPGARNILSINSATGAGIAFSYANLSTAQAALVDARTVEYLRGERSCETGSTATCASTKNQRPRTKLLGDIVNSSPVYVGVPDELQYDDPSYLTFIAAKGTRTPVVYVGANDGMLHAFNASVNVNGTAITGVTGTEVLAYVPGAAYKNLASLADPAYKHRFFVDGNIVVGDAKIGPTATPWRSVLVSGMRSGGQAMFALDVTDPSTFTESNAASLVKWEFSDTNDVDMGYTYGEPAIAKLADGSWAAIFGNGYNNTQADGRVSPKGEAVLYIVNLSTGALIKKITTGVGFAQDPDSLSRPNGLSGVRVVDVDGDKVVDYVYAGDLFGNLWRFDLTSTTTSPWNTGPGTPATTSAPGTPLYKAVNAAGKAQSITVRPTIGPHALGLNRGYMVYFGTGRFLESADNANTGQPTQTFYGIWDQWPKTSPPSFSSFTRTALQQQAILAEVTLPNGSTGRISSNTAVDWATKKGWYMDLVVGSAANNGERVIYEALLNNGQVLFSTFKPNTTVSCTAGGGGGGGGYVTILDAASGVGPSLPPIDINADLAYDKNDLVTYNGSKYVVSGYGSLYGVPSAPFIVESAGGTADYFGVSYSNGEVGGIYDNTGGAGGGGGGVTGTPGPLNASPDLMAGRASWGRLK